MTKFKVNDRAIFKHSAVADDEYNGRECWIVGILGISEKLGRAYQVRFPGNGNASVGGIAYECELTLVENP